MTDDAQAIPPTGIKFEFEAIETFKALRFAGKGEKTALEEMETSGRLQTVWQETKGSGFGIVAMADELLLILARHGLLDEWPVGWIEEDWEKLAEHMTAQDVYAWFGRVVDGDPEMKWAAVLLSAQGYLAPVLKTIGPAILIFPEAPQFSAGKTRMAKAITLLAGGIWLSAATIAALKAIRGEAHTFIGIDEGDEAEKENPGIKGYLLACPDWDAAFLKYGEPDAKGKRAVEEKLYGGPVVVTFRKKPWPAILSRGVALHLTPSKDPRFSDDGTGDALRRLLGPSIAWMRDRCAEAVKGRDGTWALMRVHSPDFRAKLDAVTKDAVVLRQRDLARQLLFIAELLGVDLPGEIRKATVTDVELESESVVLIEAIENDEEYQAAKMGGVEKEVATEKLRLRVQKYLRDHHEFVDLSRNKFAAVLEEMGYSKKEGPTWKRVDHGNSQTTVIYPGLWAKVHPRAEGGARGTSMDEYDQVAALRDIRAAAARQGKRFRPDDLPPDARSSFDRLMKGLKAQGELIDLGGGLFEFTDDLPLSSPVSGGADCDARDEEGVEEP